MPVLRTAAVVLALLHVGACKPNVSETNQLCGKAAVMYAKCGLDANATVEQRSDMEVLQNRWIRLCRAVHDSTDENLYAGEKHLYAGLVADGSASAAKAFQCAAASTTCEQVNACE